MSEQLIEGRWGETKEALLEGLAGPRRSTMNVVLENTKRYLKENATAGSTASGNIAGQNFVTNVIIGNNDSESPSSRILFDSGCDRLSGHDVASRYTQPAFNKTYQ